MRGLAFPPDAPFNREASYEYGTPMSTGTGDDIPIDPALTGAIDPALMPEENNMKVEKFQHQISPPEHIYPHQPTFVIANEIDQVHQYSQGPQGDPFAPQVVAPYIPIEPEPVQPPPSVKPKRKRKVRREEECGFCQGNDKTNTDGEPELMATCTECGRSGHPSCMELTNIGEIIRSYPWRCVECKICELCHQKGDDAQILFCDSCDRGWHMYCFNPPITETPRGQWACPQCPPIFPGHPLQMMVDASASGPYDMQVEASPQAIPPTYREHSIASTSQSRSTRHEQEADTEEAAKPRRGRPPTGKPKGRPRKVPVQKAEEEGETMDVEEHSSVRKSARSSKISKRSRVLQPERREDSSEDDEPVFSPLRSSRRKRPREPSPIQSLPRVRLRLPTQQKGKGKEREEDEQIHGIFDDILSIEDRETSKTTITRGDKLVFERSRMSAEQKLNPAPPPLPTTARSTTSDFPELLTPGPSRPLRSATLQYISTSVPSVSTPLTLSASPGPSTPGGPLRPIDTSVLRIRTIRFGEYDIKTWYDAPFPEEYANIPDGRLWICEFCLKYMKSRFGAVRHRVKCKARHPPGDEIYRDGAVSIFEVDGRRNKIYCQNLCLLSKMFLDHKSLFYDVEPFLFYVITEVDDIGARFVGYFSKEKRSPKDYNVSCIMTLPVRQRQGWGNLLIDFSYLLSKKEERMGSPEKPLSNLGAIGYRKYWTLSVMRYLEHAPDSVRLEDISAATSMTFEDICQILIEQNMIYMREPSPPVIRPSPGQAIKFPKGRKNGVARRQLQRMQTKDKDSDAAKGPFVPPKHYEIHFDRQKVSAFMRSWEAKGYLKLKPEKLQWTPYLLSRTLKTTEEPVPVPDSGSSEPTPAVEMVASPNGLEKEEQESSRPLDLFSPPPESPDDEGELPTPKLEPRSRTRAAKKSPSKAKERRPRSPSPMLEKVTPPPPPRRLRSRPSRSSTNGPNGSPETMRSLRKSRKARASAGAGGADEEEDGEPFRHLRSSRSKPHLKKLTASDELPVPVRKRKRIESPEAEQEEEVEVVEEAAEEAETGRPETTATSNGIHVNGEQEYSEVGPSEGSGVDVNGADGHQPESKSRESSEAAVLLDDQGSEVVAVESVAESEGGSSAQTGEDVFSVVEAIQNGQVHGALHAESDLRSTLVVGVEGSEYCDEDADGEYEEDAEGEPDPEVYS